LVELTEQCRVLDAEFEEEVLRPLRETDFGPTKKGRRILHERIIDGGPEVMEELTVAGTRLIAYCNAQKCDHMRTRAQRFAVDNGKRLYWSIAKDLLSGEGTRRAWADRWASLADQKTGWLNLDDKKTGKRMGCLPLCIGLPVYLEDHLNRPRGLVAGLRGTINHIWFDGEPPTETNSSGEFNCAKARVFIVDGRRGGCMQGLVILT
jgi:hypothetical protein